VENAWGGGSFQLLSWLLVEIVEFMHALLDLLFLDAGDVIYLFAPKLCFMVAQPQKVCST